MKNKTPRHSILAFLIICQSVLCLSSEGSGPQQRFEFDGDPFVDRYDITTNTIAGLPILALFYETEDELECRLHLRETAWFEGLRQVRIYVIKEDSQKIFSGALSLHEYESNDHLSTGFTVSKDKISHTELRISVFSPSKLPDGPMYSQWYFFIPMDILHQHFKANKFVPWESDVVNSAKIQQFLKSEFELDSSSQKKTN